MDKDSLKKQLAAHERDLRDAIRWMEAHPVARWDEERVEQARRAQRARLQRDRLQSQIDVNGSKEEA